MIGNEQYVISCDLDIQSNKTKWIQNERLDKFRESLTDDLIAQGKNVSWVESSGIREFFRKEAKDCGLAVVSMDNRYIGGTDQLGISRAVDDKLNDVGLGPRSGYRSVDEQFYGVEYGIKRRGKEIMLVDDVIFSGNMATWVIDQFTRRGMTVRRMIAGIAIGDGVKLLAERGIEVEALYNYAAVEDEVCERDFAFVPGSGRRMVKNNANALYWDTEFGRPEEWASIRTDSATGFMMSSIERSMRLLKPDTPMSWVGRMNGYVCDGLAADALQKRRKAI